MVDLLGMFRRRPAKRNPPGFARTRPDITSLEDAMDMLENPVRDAPRVARDGVRDPAPPKPETPRNTPSGKTAPARPDQWRGSSAANPAGGLSGCA
jgi:lipopolysaccharide export system ATP-binding protein